MCHHEKMRSCDSDCVAVKAGELIIRIPKDVYGIPGLWGRYCDDLCLQIHNLKRLFVLFRGEATEISDRVFFRTTKRRSAVCLST